MLTHARDSHSVKSRFLHTQTAKSLTQKQQIRLSTKMEGVTLIVLLSGFVLKTANKPECVDL